MTLHTKTKKGVHSKITALLIAGLLALAATCCILAPKITKASASPGEVDLPISKSGNKVIISPVPGSGNYVFNFYEGSSTNGYVIRTQKKFSKSVGGGQGSTISLDVATLCADGSLKFNTLYSVHVCGCAPTVCSSGALCAPVIQIMAVPTLKPATIMLKRQNNVMCLSSDVLINQPGFGALSSVKITLTVPKVAEPVIIGYTKDEYIAFNGYIPINTWFDFSAYGEYSISLLANYEYSHDKWDVTSNLYKFTHSPFTSGDSNYVDITIGKYTTPTLIAANGNFTLSGGASFGDTYTLNIGNRATNKIVSTVTNPWTTTLIGMDSAELIANLTHGTAYDVWAMSNGKNLFKNSDKSAALRFTVYDDISVTLSGSAIAWESVNGVSDYKVNVDCDGTITTKTVKGNSIEFNEFDIINGVCYISVEVVSSTLALSKSNSIVIKVSQLTAPLIRVDGANLVWDAVEGANGYRVFYNETFIDVTEPTIDLMSLDLDLGNYNLKVRAIGNLNLKDKLSFRSVSTYLTQMVAVNYNVDGDITSKLLEYGSALDLPTVTIAGKIFEGWYYDKDFTKIVNAGDTVTSNISLYAKLSDTPTVVPTFWQKVWSIAKQVLIWGGVALGGVLAVLIVVKFIKKRRG